MKILLVHNFYGSSAPSGENEVFLAEKKLLSDNEHDIVTYTRHSDEIRSKGINGSIQGALSTPWNPSSKKQIRKILIREQPDIMHVHNFFPLLSPSIFSATRGLKTSTVLTLHNYRIFCAAAIVMREGKPCIECLKLQSVIPALKHGCYRSSRISTLPLAIMIELHRRLDTWHNHVDTMITLTDFQKDRMVECGLPKDKISVKPHFFNNNPNPIPWEKRNDYIVYLGRLSDEKGCEIFLRTWQEWGSNAPKLIIIGDGPLKDRLEKETKKLNLHKKIDFFGQLPFDRAQEILKNAKLFIFPSMCFEGFPMVIGEAFSHGVPVVASDLGAMAHIISEGENGVLFNPGDHISLVLKLKMLWENQPLLSYLSRNARLRFLNHYRPETSYEQIIEIYNASIERKMSILDAASQ